MNHELNNSLAPIRSLVHSARQAAGRPEHAHRAGGHPRRRIEERATHLAGVPRGLRALRAAAPPAAGARWPGPSSWRACARMMPFRARRASRPAEPGWFDPAQMQQVLINLLKNAHEAGSAAGGGRRCRCTAPPHGRRRCACSTAAGAWTTTVMKRALLPFYSSKPAGTGVGLPLCQEIVEAHGGRLRVQNRAGGGLVVTCVLPP